MAQLTGSLVVKGTIEADSLTGSLEGTATQADQIWVNNYATYNGNQRIAFVGGVSQHHALRADTEFNFNPGQNRLVVPNATFSGNVKAQLLSQSAQITLADTSGNLSGSRIIGDIQASSVEFTNVLNKPTLLSSSAQVDFDSLTNVPSELVSASGGDITVDGVLEISEGPGFSIQQNMIVGLNSGKHIRNSSISDNNTVVGVEAGYAMSAGSSDNVIIGSRALYNSADDGLGVMTNNTLIGHEVMEDGYGLGNVVVGRQSMLNANLANSNVVIGNNSLDASTNVGTTVVIGGSAGKHVTGGSLNILIGRGAGPTTDGSITGKLYIDVEETDTPLIYGDFVTNEVTINGDLDVVGTVSGSFTGDGSSLTGITFDTPAGTVSSSAQTIANLPTNIPSASNAHLHLNAMGGYQQTGSIRFGRQDGIGRYHEIEGYNTNNAANSYMSFRVHNGSVDGTQEVIRLRGDGTAKAPFLSQSAQVDLASATGNAANADNATTASYVSGSSVDGEVYEAENARRIEVGSYGSYSSLTDIPFITGTYSNSIRRISSDGALRWHAGTNHLTVKGVDATQLTGSLAFSSLVGVPALVSSSAQVLNSGVVSGSAQVVSLLDNQDVDLGTGDITASAFSGDGSGLTNIPSDALSLPAGLISSSDQVNATSITNFDSEVENALSNNSVDFGTGTVEAATIETGRINSDIDSAENITFENQRIKFRVGEGYQTGQEVFTIERDTDGAYDVTVFKGYNTSANFQVRGNTNDNLLLVKSTFDRVAIGGDTYDELFCVNGHQKIRNGILRMYQDGGGSQQRNLIIGDSAANRIHNGDLYASTFHTNTIIGDQAGRSIDVGSHTNVLIGDWIGYEYTDMGDWTNNVVVGNFAARYAVDMEYSVAIGRSALPNGGNYNTAIGYGALSGTKKGEYNVGLDTLTGFHASSSAADANVYIGYKAGPNNSESSTLKKADAQLYIGYDTGELDTLVRGDMRRRNFRLNVTDDYQYLNRIGQPGFYVTGSSYFTGSVDVYQQLTTHDDVEVTGSLDVSGTITGTFSGDGSSLTGIDIRNFGGDGSITGSLKVTSFVTASEFRGNATTATRIDGFTDLNDVAGNYPLLMTANSQSGQQDYGAIGFGGTTTNGGGLYFNPDRSGNNTDCQLTVGNSGNTGILDVDRIDMGADILIYDGVIRMLGYQNGGSIQFSSTDDPASQNTGHLWRDGTELYFGKSISDKSKVVTDSDEILKIKPSSPLPTGAVGNLAVSASNLYFHNGSSWSQIN